jgi:hypothetical protein
MPSSLVGLFLFIVLLAPGFCFIIQRESRTASREFSTFRETATLALISFSCNAVVLITFAGLRALLPKHTPDVGRLVREGKPYLIANYAYLSSWALGLLAVSCVLALLLGTHQPKFARIVTRSVTPTSAWWELFGLYPNARIYVGCELEDGSYLGGELFTYNTEMRETGDREVTLSAPIRYRLPGKSAITLKDVSAVSVSARRVKFMTVSYLELESTATQLSPDGEPADEQVS